MKKVDMKKLGLLALVLSAGVGLGFYVKDHQNEAKPKDKKNQLKPLKMGVFSMSLNVRNLQVSKAFYEKLGFTVFGGNEKQKYLILKNEKTIIGLFEGMFEKNRMTFNPGWDENAQNIEKYDDVRVIEKHLTELGIAIETRVEDGTSGPGSMFFKDPDGNLILVDQHR